MILYKDYSFVTIETFAEQMKFEMTQFGEEFIGEQFLLLKSGERNLTVSFVLTGYSASKGTIYTCIYTDIK